MLTFLGVAVVCVFKSACAVTLRRRAGQVAGTYVLCKQKQTMVGSREKEAVSFLPKCLPCRAMP